MALSVVPPEEVTDLVAFRPSLADSALPTQLDYSVTGYVSQCGTEATLCYGSRLRNYQTQTGRLSSELRLGRQERPLAGPFVNFVHAGKALVAVTVQGASGGPLLCVCHPSSGRVIRAVHLTAPATHLALVSDDRLGELTGGWLALATADRRLLLLGLCLDSGLHYSDGSRPAKVVAVEGLSSSDVSDLSPAHHGGPVHPCVHVCDLDNLVDIEGQMPGGDEDLEVTCLEWLPQLGCLGIGQACGNVHLWDVETLTSVLAMSCASDLPVVSLVVQEPENDPRCFCYLWVAQGTTTATTHSASTLSCFSTTTMHSLSFQRKETRQDGRHIYREFHHARPMFEYPLVPDVVGGGESVLQPASGGGEEMGSHIVSFRTVPPPQPHAVKTAERPEDLGVLLLCWQLMRAGRVVGSYLSVFDINQWYRAHMPHVFRLSSLQQCSYMGLFSLGEAVAKCGGHTLLDVRVLPSSVKKFLSPDPLVEQAHYPSSLAFSCVCLTAEGTVHASFLGMQRQLLHNMNVEGPQCLNEANDLCARLSVAGLIGNGIRSSVFQQGLAAARAKVLNVALEHRMVGFLVACLRGPTRTGPRDSARELLLPFMLKWTWAKVKEVKSSLDKLYVPLFDCSGQDVTQVGQRMAVHLEELSILHRLLEHACSMNTEDPGLVEMWCDVAGLLAGHLRVLLFLLHSKVLPDHRMIPGVISYPCTILRSWCMQARRDLGGKLLVDVLVEAAWAGTEEAATIEFRGGDYPASSIQLALEVYLCRGLQPWAPHALTYYLLLDICSVIVHDHPAVEENLERFPAAFGMGADLRSLVEGIWSIDHGVHKEGLEQLQRARSLATPKLGPLLAALWGPAVRMLLRRNEAALALCALGHLPPAATSTPKQLALQLDVLLANGRVIDALELVRKHSQLSRLDQLLGSIVALANRGGKLDTRRRQQLEARKQLDLLLQVPLSAAEEEQLTGFFCELADPAWLCQVALHFLQCGRPHTALPLAATIREIFREGRSQQQRQHQWLYPEEVRKQAAATLELMQSFMRLVPLPASQQRGVGARSRRDACGAPVHFLGTVSTRVPHRGTTPRMVSRVSAVRATMDTTEASSKPTQPPRTTERHTPTEQHGSRKSSLGGRRVSLHVEMEAEALSMLRTPPVQRWQGPVAGETSLAGPASLHTPTSILKRRTMDLPPLASTPTPAADEVACPPTPPSVNDICPTPDPTMRKLRFAVSDTSLSETGPDLDTSARSVESSELDQSKERSSYAVSFSQQSATDGPSEPSSQFVTASESEDESGTELQEEELAEQKLADSADAVTAVTEAAIKSLEEARKRTDAYFTGLKERTPVPAFLLQEAARCLPRSSTLDVSITGLPGEESPPSRGPRTVSPIEQRLPRTEPRTLSPAKEGQRRGPRTPSPIAERPTRGPRTPNPVEERPRTPSPIVEEATDDEEADLDATPLADDDEGDGLGAQRIRGTSLGQVGAREGATMLEEEEEEEEEPVSARRHVVQTTKSVVFLETKMSSVAPPRSATGLLRPPDQGGTALMEEASSKPSSEESSAMSLRVPVFVPCEGPQRKPRLVEEVIEISTSEEASNSDKPEEEEEDEEIVILSDNSSEMPRRPDGTDSREADWSRSPLRTDAYREGGHADTVSSFCDDSSAHSARGVDEGENDAVLTELSSMEPILPLEPLEVARESSLGLLTPAADVEEAVEVEQSLSDDNDAVLRRGSLPSTGSLPSGGFPGSETEVQFKGATGPINVSFGFVPALDRSTAEDTQSSVEEIATAVAGMGPSATVDMFMPQVVVERLESSPTSPEFRTNVPEVEPSAMADVSMPKVVVERLENSPIFGEHGSRVAGDVGKKSVSPPVSPKRSPPTSGRLDTRGEEGAKVGQGTTTLPLVSPKRSPAKSGGRDSGGEESPKVQAVKMSSPLSPKRSPPKSSRRDSKDEGSPKVQAAKMSPPASPKHSPTKSGRLDSKGEESPKVQTVKPAEGSVEPSSQGTVESSYYFRERRKSTLKGEEGHAESTTSPGRGRRRKSGSVPPSHPTPFTPVNAGVRSRGGLEESAKELASQARKARAASEEPMSAHSRKKRKVSPSPPRKAAKKSSPVKPDTPSPGRKASKSIEKAQSTSPKRKAQTPSPRGKTQSPGGKTPSPGVRREKTESPKRTPGRPKKASSVSRRLATPSPKKKESTPSPKKASVGKMQAATPSPKKQSPASPKKTPPLQSRAKTASPRPKLEEHTRSTKIRSAAKGTGRKMSAVRSPPTQTAKTPGKRTPVSSAVKSPPKKAVRKTPSPSKTASEAVPSSDVKQEPLATPARLGASATPKKRVTTPTKSAGTRRKSTAAASSAGLDTITEVDDGFAEEDTETGVSTRTRHHSPSNTKLAAKPLRSARLSRRVSSGTALDTIAEVPAAEAQEEAATPARPGRGRPSKRRASEQAETTTVEPPSSVKEPAPPRKRGRKPAEPTGADSPPITRHRLQPQKGRTPTAKSPSSGRGTGEVPKTKRRGRVVIVPVLTGTPGQRAARTRATAGTGTQSTTPAQRATAPRRRYKLTWKQTAFSVPASSSRISSSAASADSASAGRPSSS